MDNVSGCLGCADRRPGCHSGCERYRRFVEKMRAEKAELQKQRELSRPAGYGSSITEKLGADGKPVRTKKKQYARFKRFS